MKCGLRALRIILVGIFLVWSWILTLQVCLHRASDEDSRSENMNVVSLNPLAQDFATNRMQGREVDHAVGSDVGAATTSILRDHKKYAEDDDDTTTSSSSSLYCTQQHKKNVENGLENDAHQLCECVNCQEDALCGKLWNGTQLSWESNSENKTNSEEVDIYKKEIHVVMSHCKTDLTFLADFIDGFNVVSIHVISKCGFPVKGAPPDATIEVLPNVGRCDHSYAYYITNILDQKLQLGRKGYNGEDAIVAFLKDNAGARNLHQPGRWNSLHGMIQVASSRAGFSCGIVPDAWPRNAPKYLMSAFYELESLRKYEMVTYSSRNKYASDNVSFGSELANWDLFYKSLQSGANPASVEPELVQMCFGGVFAASVKNIKRRNMEMWQAAEKALSRGDNIQEGHYMERMWAMLLASPLKQYQIEAIKIYSDYTFKPGYEEGERNEAFTGGLAKRLKEKKCPQEDEF